MKLLNRGYPEEMILEQFRRSANFDRQDFLKPVQYPHSATHTPIGAEKPKFKPTFILTYNPHNPPLSQWFDKYQAILASDPKMRQIFPRKPSVVFRQAPNLKRKLTRSGFRALPFPEGGEGEEEEAGCYRYEHQGRGRPCETCPRLNVSRTFTSKFTRRTYKMRHRLTCKSTFVVYSLPIHRFLHQVHDGQTCRPQTGGTREKLQPGDPFLRLWF